MIKPKDIKIIVGCEESQAVCIAFRERGFNAFSCDLKDCSGPAPRYHIKDDILNVIKMCNWHCLIAHPPCTYLSFAANRVWDEKGRVYKRLDALKFFADLYTSSINYIAIENPKSCASPVISKYDQIIQPYYFGDPFLKTTCLWLKNLPKLKWSEQDNLFEKKTSSRKPEPMMITFRRPGKNYKGGEIKKRYYSDTVDKEVLKKHNIQFTEFNMNKGKIRSKTFPGIAKAMAEQWGEFLLNKLNNKL